MSFPSIDQNLVDQYSSSVQMLVQQKQSKLLPHVMVDTQTGERGYHEQYGVHGDPSQVTTRLKDYDLKDIVTSRRAVDLERFIDVRAVDSFDKVRMLADMTSSINMAQSAQMGRFIDKKILQAARGAALSGKTGSTTVNLAAANKVAIDSHKYDSGSGNVAMTVSKFQEIQEKFDDAQVDLEDRFFVLDPVSYQNLITDAKASSQDYIGQRPFGDRHLETFLGTNLIVLPTSQFESSGAGKIYNIAFGKEGLLAVTSSTGMIKGDIFEDKKKESIGTYIAKAQLDFGATRLQEACVVEVENVV